jgi:sec-independent protein translocase protein TatB
MFDLGSWGEFLIIFVAALVLLGPKELPVVLRTAGRWIYKLRKMTAQFRAQVEPFLQEGEIEAYIKDAQTQVKTQDEALPLIKETHVPDSKESKD